MGKAKPKTYRKEHNHSNLSKKLKTIEETTNLVNEYFVKLKAKK
jgi:hypothetical protein